MAELSCVSGVFLYFSGVFLKFIFENHFDAEPLKIYVNTKMFIYIYF